MLGHRSSDAVITICQNNELKMVEIRDINRNAEDILGYAPFEMNMKELVQFLPVRIQELIHEYVEYEEDANDVGSVLGKVQNFVMIDKQGREVTFRLKVVRSESLDQHSYFKLILQDKQGIIRNEAFRKMLMENFKGHEAIDATTGLPDRNSIAKDIELILHYVSKGELISSFAIIEIDNFDKIADRYEAQTALQLHQHIAALAKKNLRTEDTIGTLSRSQMGLILLDAGLEPARMVLNRFRWLIGSTPYIMSNKAPLAFTVSVSFTQIGGRDQNSSIIEDCEFVLKTEKNSNNALLQVGNVEKRREDRRKSTVPVEFDRRSGMDRRLFPGLFKR